MLQDRLLPVDPAVERHGRGVGLAVGDHVEVDVRVVAGVAALALDADAPGARREVRDGLLTLPLHRRPVPEMEGHLPGMGVGGLHLEVRLGPGSDGRDGPHGQVLVLEAVVLEVVGLHHVHIAEGRLPVADAVDDELGHLVCADGLHVRLVPDDLRLRPGPVGEDGGDGIGQGEALPHPHGHHRGIEGVRQLQRVAPGPQEGEGLEGFQGLPVEAEQGLVVAGAAAVILARVVGVIFGRVAAGPAAAVLLPQGATVRPGGAGHGDPARLPVEDADARVQRRYGGRHVPDLPALALDGEGVGLLVLQLLADGVGAVVPVGGGVGPLGLGHHDLLPVLLSHGGELLFEVVQRPVPVGVVGGGKHVVIHLVAGEHVG